MEIPAVSLKTIILVHWLLTSWGCLMSWLPPAYAWSNFTVLAVGVWAVAQRDSVDAIFMFLAGMVITIIMDIIDFSIYYPAAEMNINNSTFRFSAGMAILSLILKPLSCFCAYQMYRERGGENTINVGFITISSVHSTYQTIDQQNNSTYQSIDQQVSPVNPPYYREQGSKTATRI